MKVIELSDQQLVNRDHFGPYVVSFHNLDCHLLWCCIRLSDIVPQNILFIKLARMVINLVKDTNWRSIPKLI
jgi:hypothetical protein